jgi:hypothetical protein
MKNRFPQFSCRLFVALDKVSCNPPSLYLVDAMDLISVRKEIEFLAGVAIDDGISSEREDGFTKWITNKGFILLCENVWQKFIQESPNDTAFFS